MSVGGGVKGTIKLVFRGTSSERVSTSSFCSGWGGGGGGKNNLKLLRLRGTSSDSLTCINVVIFVGVGKMNVKPCFSLQVPPPIC